MESKLVYVSTPIGNYSLHDTVYSGKEDTPKIAHGMVDYRKGLVVKAARVGMTFEQYCNRFNIKL